MSGVTEEKLFVIQTRKNDDEVDTITIRKYDEN